MNSIKIIHTADLHLGSGRTAVKNGSLELENTFFRIIELCKTENIDFLLIAGDLFDTPFVAPALAERVISAISQIPETIVAIVPGNHDCACPGSVYLKHRFPDNTVIFTSFLEYIDFPNKHTRLWGAGFTERFESIPLLNQITEKSDSLINLGVLHGELVADASPSSYNPISHSAIKDSGLDYLALGHIHKRSAIQSLGKTQFSYSGCPDGRGFDESGSQGIYMGEISKDCCKLDYIELSSRQYIIDNMDITLQKNSFEIADFILNKIKSDYGDDHSKNLYRITLTGEISADSSIAASQIQAILSSHTAHITIYDETNPDLTNISQLANEQSLRGIFVKKMLERINNAPPEEQRHYKSSLKLGLKAFNMGVMLNDN